MELQSLTFALFITPLLFFKLVLAVDPFASSPLSPPSPSPSPSPSPTFAPRIPPRDHLPDIDIASPRPPQASNGSQEQSRGKTAGRTSDIDHLNLGKKVGLSFLAVAVGLQVVLGGFLVCTRIQLRKMEPENLPKVEPSHPSSP